MTIIAISKLRPINLTQNKKKYYAFEPFTQNKSLTYTVTLLIPPRNQSVENENNEKSNSVSCIYKFATSLHN